MKTAPGRQIRIIGTGLSDGGTLTRAAQEWLDGSDLVVGAQRLLELVDPASTAKRFAAIMPDDIVDIITKHPSAKRVSVLMSGDTGFYSGTTKLLPLLYGNGYDIDIIPGVSSVQALAARLQRPWQSWRLVSAHGRGCDPITEVRDHAETFFLTGGGWTVPVIAAALTEAGFGECIAHVGECLGSPDERIVGDKLSELAGKEFASLSVMLVENPEPRSLVTTGIPDEAFIRDKAPMTKSEVRAVVLSKMWLREDSVVWDIGAGTGSVSIEAALLARRGHVYAVECDEEACELIERNKLAFQVCNLDVRHGLAPEACADLPVPDVVFIGGSKGNLEEIAQCILRKTTRCRIVATAVTLETIAEAERVFSSLILEEYEAVSVSVARTRELGGYHLLTAQNPIMIFSGTLRYDIRM